MADPYKTGMFVSDPYAKKKEVRGRLVAVLDGVYDGRGLELIPQPSRVLCRDEIHELILTDQVEASPGARVDRIAYVAFFEVLEGGVVLAGDEVVAAGAILGTVAGFDLTHAPNHLNIVMYGGDRRSGARWELELDGEVTFRRGPGGR